MKKELLALSLLALTGCSTTRELPESDYANISKHEAKSFECAQEGYFSQSLYEQFAYVVGEQLKTYTYDIKKLDSSTKWWRDNTSPDKSSCASIEQQSRNGINKFYGNRKHTPVKTNESVLGLLGKAFLETFEQQLGVQSAYKPLPEPSYKKVTPSAINLPSVTKPNTNSDYLNKQHQIAPKVYQSLTSSVRNGNSIVCTYSLGKVKYIKIHERCPTSLY